MPIFEATLKRDQNDTGRALVIRALDALGQDPVVTRILGILKARTSEAYTEKGRHKRGADSPLVHAQAALREREIPVVAGPVAQREALGRYGGALVGFNASLNGDLNLRLFEIAAAGGALLTDRLAPESGLAEVICGSAGVTTYADATELADRAADLLAHPAEARARGETAARWFDENLSAVRRRAAFRALAFDGVSPFPLPAAGAPLFDGDLDRLLPALMVYEGVQELHRTQESVRVWLDCSVPEEIVRMYATLPRVACDRSPLAAAGADLAVFGREFAGEVRSDAARLWCWDASPADFAPLAETFAGVGCGLASQDVAVFCRLEAAEVC